MRSDEDFPDRSNPGEEGPGVKDALLKKDTRTLVELHSKFPSIGGVAEGRGGLSLLVGFFCRKCSPLQALPEGGDGISAEFNPALEIDVYL